MNLTPLFFARGRRGVVVRAMDYEALDEAIEAAQWLSRHWRDTPVMVVFNSPDQAPTSCGASVSLCS